MKRLLMAASSGGHLEEVLALKPLKDKYETILLTEKTDYSVRFWQDRIYLLPQMNRREIKGILSFLGSFITVARIFRKEKPDAVLSTGAMVTFPAIFWGRLLGKKIIFVECLFNVDKPTLTGKLAYRFADLFIVQWQEMLQVYPRAVYGGKVF